MPFTPPLTAGLCCPCCPDGQLALLGDGLTCVRCDNRYPFIGTIPCLLEDPSLWRSLWLSRMAGYLSDTESLIDGWRAEANQDDLIPRTRQRIARTIAGTQEQRTILQALFGDLTAGLAQVIPTRPEPGENPLLACYENLFRDWAWGDKESEVSLSLVAGIVPEALGRLAVYGAGGGRLAVDLHQALRPTETFALDTNPLPLLVAEKLVHGETVDLPEFPVAPDSDDHVVVTQHLRCPPQVRDGFTFLFADALRPPFAPGSLDAVVTPWFIDVVRGDVRQTAAAINRVLRSGGLWINVGPLRFKTELSRQYVIEEVWDIVEHSAFALLARTSADVPYFDSPISGFRRTETVFCFTARKIGEAAPVPIPAPVPAWIADPSLPIPLTRTIVQLGQRSIFTAGALSLVDGVRSISNVVDELRRSTDIDAALLLDQVRAFFAKLPSA